MTNENGSSGQAKTPLQLEAIEKETRAFECPACHERLQFRVGVIVKGVQVPLTPEENAARDGLPLPPTKMPNLAHAEQVADHQLAAETLRLKRLAQYYKDAGILTAFLEIASELKSHQMPKDPAAFFLNWLRTCVAVPMIPKFALQRLVNEFDHGQIEVQQAQGIGAVISDGVLRCFVAMHLLRGEVIRAGGGSNTKLRTSATDAGLDNWIRTRHGYVLGGSLLFGEMKRQAKGSFELTVK